MYVVLQMRCKIYKKLQYVSKSNVNIIEKCVYITPIQLINYIT